MKKIAVLFAVFYIYMFAAAQKNNVMFKSNTQKIDSLLSNVYNESLPGISIGIIKDGKVVFKKSYGIGSITGKEKLTSASNFNICSLTKQFTALAILQLQQKHLLTLNDKLSRFFPQMNKKLAGSITIQQLLTHTSGMPDHYDYTNTTNMLHAHDSDVYAAIKNADTTYFKPGTKFRYSNTAYCLLALIIEKLSGLRYNGYMQQNIFKPAGMAHTIVWSENAVIPNEVTAYERDSLNNLVRSGAAEHIFFSTEGDGGIYTSVDDYIKWFEALQSAQVFDKKIIDEARSIEFSIDKNKKAGYGFGWFVDELDVERKVYHSGDNGGFKTYSFSIPSLNYLVVIFSNRSDINIEQIVQQIVNIQLPSVKDFTPVEVLTS